MNSPTLEYQLEIEKLANERGCSRRTAAKLLRGQSHQREALKRQAVQVASHVDWGQRTDIAPDIRELAEVIRYYGVKSVPNAVRNSILEKLPRSLKCARD